MSSLSALLFLAGSIFSSFGTNHAYAVQTDAGKPTPDQLAECRQLGIKAEKCSEQAILTKRGWDEFFRREAIRDAEGVKIDNNLVPIYIGIAGAFAAGVIYVKKVGRWKSKTSS